MFLMNRSKYYNPVVYRKTNATDAFRPKVNIVETQEAYQLMVALPGFERSDLNITLEDEVLTVASKKQHEQTNVIHTEFKTAPFKRSFALPRSVEAGKIEAKMVNGILEITLAKKAKQVIAVA